MEATIDTGSVVYVRDDTTLINVVIWAMRPVADVTVRRNARKPSSLICNVFARRVALVATVN